MSCHSCLRSFSLLRPEKGCPACGFSYCSKCINNKVFLPKLNSEVKVCGKCKNKDDSKLSTIPAPDAYYKRITAIESKMSDICSENTVEQEIKARLEKLKGGISNAQSKDGNPPHSTDKDIEERLKLLKAVPTTSHADLEQRLANIKGIPINKQPVLPPLNVKSDEEQANDLLQQYMKQTNIENQYKDEFDQTICNIETRLQTLKGLESTKAQQILKNEITDYSEDEEETAMRIIDKAMHEAAIDDRGNDGIGSATNDELPFCEICNEDASLRCLGCKYLFCKRCFNEHRDEEDGCDKYETYKAPKDFKY